MISPGLIRSQHSVVGTETKLRAGRTRNRGSIPRRCQVFIFCPERPDPVVDLTQLLGTGAFFLAIKWPGSESDHSPHPLVNLRMSGAVSPLPCMSWWRAGGICTFTLLYSCPLWPQVRLSSQWLPNTCLRSLYRRRLAILGILYIEKKSFTSNVQVLGRNLFRLFRDFDSLRAGRSEDRMPVGARFSAPAQTDFGPTKPAVQWVPLLLLQG
jgi:hypothetical protein